MGSKVLDKEWILNHLEQLTAHSDALVDLAPTPDTDPTYGPLTALKLFLVISEIDVYTQIVPKKFKYPYYIDALAGSGITHVNSHDISLAGSPLIAATMSHQPLERYYFIEEDSDRAETLAARLDYLHENTTISIPRERCEIRNADANQEIPNIIDEIKQHGDTYGFRHVNRCAVVDNEGLNVKWQTIDALMQIWGDTLINFPATGISRRRGKARHDLITRFFGTTAWKDCDTEAEYRNLYCDRLAATAAVPLKQRSVRVNSRTEAKRYYYDLLYNTRRTENDSPYAAAIDALKTRYERLDGDDVAAILDLIYGAEQTNFHVFEGSANDTQPETDSAQQQLDQYV